MGILEKEARDRSSPGARDLPARSGFDRNRTVLITRESRSALRFQACRGAIFQNWSRLRMDGFWKPARPLGSKAGRGGAFGVGDCYFRFSRGGYVEAQEAH